MQDESKPGEGTRTGELLNIQPAEAIEIVTGFAREHPHAAIAGACAVGFVLGGGVTPRIVGAIALVLARQALRRTLDESLQTFVEAARHGGTAGSEGS